MAKLTFTVEFSVDPSWIADGFILSDERAMNMLANDLGFAYPHELGAKVISSPPIETLAELQGYESVKDFERSLDRDQLESIQRGKQKRAGQ